MASENIFLFYALIMGIYITFLYDVLRIARRVWEHNYFWIAIEDIGFWLYCASEVFILMYHVSNGRLRWFAIFGALLGMWVYRKFVSPYFVKYSSMFLRKIMLWLGKILQILVKPLWLIGRRLKKKLTYVRKVLKMMVK